MLRIIIWAVVSFLLVVIISFIVFIPVSDQLDSSFDDYYNSSLPIWWLVAFFGIPTILFPILFLSKIVSISIGEQSGSCNNVKIILFSTFACVVFSFFGMFNTLSLFLYFSFIVTMLHLTAYKYKNTIHTSFYKKLEYVYVVIAIAGMISVATTVNDIQNYKINELESRISEAKNNKQLDYRDQIENGWFSQCDASSPPAWCFDYDEISELEVSLNNIKSEYQLKISAEMKLIGYVFIAFSIAIKLLKVTGELNKWHRVDDVKNKKQSIKNETSNHVNCYVGRKFKIGGDLRKKRFNYRKRNVKDII